MNMNLTIKSGEQAFTVTARPSDPVVDLRHTVQPLKKFVDLSIKPTGNKAGDSNLSPQSHTINPTIKSGEEAFTVTARPSDLVIDLKHTIQSLKKFVVLSIDVLTRVLLTCSIQHSRWPAPTLLLGKGARR